MDDENPRESPDGDLLRGFSVLLTFGAIPTKKNERSSVYSYVCSCSEGY